MKPLILAILIAVSSVFDGAARSKFDSYSQIRMRVDNVRTASGPRKLPVDATVSAIVTSTDADTTHIDGVTILAHRGNISVVSATMADLERLAESPRVSRISLSRPITPTLVNARPLVGADKSQSGVGLSRAFTGKGTITGLFDVGLDAHHVNFNNQETDKTRIQRIWTFQGTDGTPTAYDTPEQIAAFTTDSLTETHATHVLGCMSGSYNGVGGRMADSSTRTVITGSDVQCPFYGVATDANIAASVGRLYDANILVGVDRIAAYADSIGQPAVINLSLGSLIGPHDGTDPFCQFLDSIGNHAIVCLAAGNNGHQKISIVKTLNQEDPSVRTFLWMTPTYSGSGYISVWSSSPKPFAMQPVIYDQSTGKIVYSYTLDALTDSAVAIATSSLAEDGDITNAVFDKTFSDSYILLSSSLNGDSTRYGVLMAFDMKLNPGTNADGNLVPGIIVTADPGVTIQMTNESPNIFSARSLSGWTEGSPALSISDLACGHKVISVGAYTSRAVTTYLDGSTFDYGTWGLADNEICYFSSYGTLLDGRQLPLVCAPGARITSSVSRYWVAADSIGDDELCAQFEHDGEPNYYADKQGTSMSCPIVAGAIALWLEADPTLTVADVQKLISETSATADRDTSSNPIQWGSGGIDVYAGLLKICQSLGVTDIRADKTPLDVVQTPEGLIITNPTQSRYAIAVCDTSGRLVHQAQTGAESYTVSLAPGIYIANINNSKHIKFSVK